MDLSDFESTRKTMATSISDGIHSLLPREKMCPAARKLRDTYARKPNAPFFQREFGTRPRGCWLPDSKHGIMPVHDHPKSPP